MTILIWWSRKTQLKVQWQYKTLTVNSGTSVSVSKNTEMCQTLEDENKCYKTFGGPEASLVCLDEENSTSIESYCVDDSYKGEFVKKKTM